VSPRQPGEEHPEPRRRGLGASLRRRLRPALPRNRAEVATLVTTFGSWLGASVLLELTYDHILPLLPVGLAVGGALFLVTTSWLRTRQDPLAPPPLSPPGLPRPVERLIGRDALLAEARALAAGGGVIAVQGRTGVGTSAVAINLSRALVQTTERQFYVNLRVRYRDRPETAGNVMKRVLRTLGLPLSAAESAPATAAEVAGTLAARTGLLLIDNVARWSQVRWLTDQPLPAGWVIIAGTLETDDDDEPPPGVPILRVEPLTPEEGKALLRDLIGDERIKEAKEIVDRLAELPLRIPALAVAIGRWLRENPRVLLAALAADLQQGSADRALQVLLDKRLRDVSASAQRLLALLAHIPLNTFDLAAAAALAGPLAVNVESAMAELQRHDLVESEGGARFTVPAGVLDITPAPHDLDRAWQRLVAWYADRADHFADRLPRGTKLLQEEQDRHGQEAQRWFSQEDEALSTILTGRPPTAAVAGALWRIADALEVWFAFEHRHTERRRTAQALARAATALKDSDVRATAELRLCLIALTLGEPHQAKNHLLDDERPHDGDESWPAQFYLARAQTLLASGDDFTAVEAALVQYGQALQTGDAEGQATFWINMAALRISRAQVHDLAGRTHEANLQYEDAHGSLTHALDLTRRAEEVPVPVQARARELRALVYWHLGRSHDATRDYAEAVRLYGACRDVIAQARCVVHQAARVIDPDPDIAHLLKEAVDRLPPTGLGTALAYLHLARADPAGAPEYRRKGLAALSPWDGIAEPRQVTEVRRRLEQLDG
jgi:tetratricopeptide (TPR) repeat protein